MKSNYKSLFLFAVAFAFGCGIGTYTDVADGVWRWTLPCVTAICLIDVVILVFAWKPLRGVRWFVAVSFFVMPVLLGLTAYDIRNPVRWENIHVNQIDNKAETIFVAVIKSDPQRTAKRLKATADVIAIKSGHSFLASCGKTVVYFDTLDTWVKPGVEMVAAGEFSALPHDIGQTHFPYRRYMQRKGVVSQCFVRCAEPVKQRNSSTHRFYRWRETLSEIVNSSRLSPEKRGVARALVLGDREAPQEITRDEFRAAGLSHLLCVSGLHVGIVALLVSMLFRPLGDKRRTRLYKGLAELVAVWLFVVMTGMAPSTLRAGVMFSFIIVGQLVTNRPASLNALGLSAITLLMIRPSMIADIGFQLSYVAVTGILVFYRPLYSLLPINNINSSSYRVNLDDVSLVGRKRAILRLKTIALKLTVGILTLLWESIVLCTAAQVCVMPLILYYFHQLTPWFLIANVLIVPFTGLLLVSIMLMMAVCGWPWAWQVMQELVDWELGLVCGITHRVAKLPYAIVDDIHFTLPMLAVAAVLLVVAATAIRRHPKT